MATIEQNDPIWKQLELNHIGNNVNFLDSINELPNDIEHLNCEDCPLESISVITRFKKLRVLNISNTFVKDLAGIEQLPKVEILYADFGQFKELHPISFLKNLRSLDITCSMAGIEDVAPLSTLQSLERLYVANNPIITLHPLFNLSSLQILTVSNTKIDKNEIEQFRILHPNCQILL